MTNLQAGRPATAVSTMVSALVGGVLLLSLGFYWPRPIIDWMRVRVPRFDGPAPADRALHVATAFIVVTLLLAAVVAVAHRLLRRLAITRPAAVLAAVMFLAFALSFAGETLSQVVRASGSLTASDSTGFIFEGGWLTAHGWETIARRALAASIYAGMMVAAFRAAHSAFTRRIGR